MCYEIVTTLLDLTLLTMQLSGGFLTFLEHVKSCSKSHTFSYALTYKCVLWMYPFWLQVMQLGYKINVQLMSTFLSLTSKLLGHILSQIKTFNDKRTYFCIAQLILAFSYAFYVTIVCAKQLSKHVIISKRLTKMHHKYFCWICRQTQNMNRWFVIGL